MKCVLCNQPIDPETPPGGDMYVREINPNTRRMADMHAFCAQVAYESLTDEAKSELEEFEIKKEGY